MEEWLFRQFRAVGVVSPTIPQANDAASSSLNKELKVANGHSVFRAVFHQDPTPAPFKIAIVGATLLSYCALPFSSNVLARELGLNAEWDSERGVWSSKSDGPVFVLMKESLGVSRLQVVACACATALIFTLLFAVDLVGLCDWPRSWDCDNRKCYNEMFCEPTREGSLVRRPGNTYSNCSYVFCAALVLASVGSGENIFGVADAGFGVMVAILSIASVIWHASNAPNSQYIDLWAMDSSICYVALRFVSVGLLSALRRSAALGGYWGTRFGAVAPAGREPLLTAEGIAATFAAAAYALVIVAIAATHRANFQKRWLHGGCPFSGRHRLRQRGKPGNLEVYTSGACLFAGLPVLYLLIPAAVTVFVGAAGSLLAGTLATSTICIGWGVRNFERFAFDGWAPMNWIIARMEDRRKRRGEKEKKGQAGVSGVVDVLLTMAAAVASPTGWLHIWTGLTLLFSYCFARTLEQSA